MKRTDGYFPTRPKPSKTDQYAKRYSNFSLGGNQLAEHSLKLCFLKCIKISFHKCKIFEDVVLCLLICCVLHFQMTFQDSIDVFQFVEIRLDQKSIVILYKIIGISLYFGCFSNVFALKSFENCQKNTETSDWR